MNTTTKVLGGIVLGAVVGLAAGILAAPKTGIQSRKLIKRKSKKYSKQAVQAVNRYMENIKSEYFKKLQGTEGVGSSSLSGERKKSVKVNSLSGQQL